MNKYANIAAILKTVINDFRKNNGLNTLAFDLTTFISVIVSILYDITDDNTLKNNVGNRDNCDLMHDCIISACKDIFGVDDPSNITVEDLTDANIVNCIIRTLGYWNLRITNPDNEESDEPKAANINKSST